jgi:hypothetical protein
MTKRFILCLPTWIKGSYYYCCCCIFVPFMWLDFMLDDPGFESRRGTIIYLSSKTQPAQEPTQPPIEWVPRALSREVKRPCREADDSPESNGWGEKQRVRTSTPTICLYSMHREDATCHVTRLYTSMYLYILHGHRSSVHPHELRRYPSCHSINSDDTEFCDTDTENW